MADDIFTQETVDKLNASALTFNEVVTSRAGGVSTGAIINQTLTPLGETTDTLKGRLDKLGIIYTDWGSAIGGMLTTPAQAFLNNTVGSDGFGNYYSWSGVYPSGGHVVAPGTDPAAAGSGYTPRTDVVLRHELASDDGADLIHTSSGFSIQKIISDTLPESGDVYDMFIVYGQSNAVGYANNTSLYPTQTNSRALFFDHTDGQIKQIIKDMPHSSGDVSTGHAWTSFANEYIKRTGRGVLIVPCAKGGTAISDLSKGSAAYTSMSAAVSSAKSVAASSGVAIGKISALWHQGETDMTNGTTRSAYQTYLDALITNIRADFVVDKFFILLVGNPQNRTEESWYAVKSAQEYLCQSYDYCVLASSSCGSYTVSNGLLRDGVHFTQNGYNVMGSECAICVSESLHSLGPTSSVETDRYGTQLMPQDQIWRYTSARLLSNGDGTVTLLDKNTSGYTYRNCNVLSVSVLSDRLRVIVQSRIGRVLGMRADVNFEGQQLGLRAAPYVTLIDPGTLLYAIDINLSCDMQFAVNPSTGALFNVPNMSSVVPTFISGNITAVLDSSSNSTGITHPGSKRIPIATSFAGADMLAGAGYVSSIGGEISETFFKVKNTGSYRCVVTIPSMRVKPATIPSGVQIDLCAVVCEERL